ISPWCMNSVSGNRGVESEDQTEKPKEQPEVNTGATLQESPNSKGDKKRPDKYHCGDRIPLRFGSRVEHQGDNIPEPDRRNSFSALDLKDGATMRQGLGLARRLSRRGESQPRPPRKETKTTYGSNQPEPTEVCQRKHIQAPAKQQNPNKQQQARAAVNCSVERENEQRDRVNEMIKHSLV